MTSLVIAFVVVLLVPLFVANWRTSLFGLALQGVLLYAIAARIEGPERSIESVVTFVDLIVVRALIAPGVLYRVLHSRSARERVVLPPNMLAWTAAIGLVILAFRVSSALVPADGDDRTLVGAVASAVFLGFLVLASRVGVFSQVMGALRIENAVALFELSNGPHAGSVGIHIAETALAVTSIGLFGWYLARMAPSPVDSVEVEDEFQETLP